MGASFAEALALALDIPALPVHHLEGHLLSPLLSSDPPAFPFVALLVSGGHTQLMRVTRVGAYELLGESLDDAAGEAFDKTAQLLGLGYPGGPALAQLAETGQAGTLQAAAADAQQRRFQLQLFRPQDRRADRGARARTARREQDKADLAAEFQEAATEVLATKALAACRQRRLSTLVVAGGVGANRRLRQRLDAAAQKRASASVYPGNWNCAPTTAR